MNMKIVISFLFCALFLNAGAIVTPNDLKNYGKVDAHPVSIEPLKALVEFTLFGILSCAGFFINKHIVALSNDCQDNIVYRYPISANNIINKTGTLNDLVPRCQGFELLRKGFKVVDETLIFAEIIEGTEDYESTLLPELTLAPKPYEIGKQLQVFGFAKHYAVTSLLIVYNVKIVNNEACKKIYSPENVNEAIHSCAEITDAGRHFCPKSTGSMVADKNTIAGIVVYPSKDRILKCKTHVLFVKSDNLQTLFEKSGLDNASKTK